MSPTFDAGSFFEFDLVGRPTPIYCIGDSHSMIYKDVVYHERRQDRTYLTKSLYCAALLAENFTDPAGRLNSQVVQALAGETLLDSTGNPIHLDRTEHAVGIKGAADANFGSAAPILLFFCGEIDLRSKFLRQLGPKTDFTLPFDAQLDRFDPIPDRQPIPYNVIHGHVKKTLAPLFVGLKQLKDSGFDRTYLHSIPPPTLDQEAFEHYNRYSCPALQRYKVAHLFNHVLSNSCREFDIPFIDIWPDVTVDGALDPRFHLEGIHLNKQASFITLRKLMAHHHAAGWPDAGAIAPAELPGTRNTLFLLELDLRTDAWQDVLLGYVRSFDPEADTTLFLWLDPSHGIGQEEAFRRLTEALREAGLDPERTPDLVLDVQRRSGPDLAGLYRRATAVAIACDEVSRYRALRAGVPVLEGPSPDAFRSFAAGKPVSA